MCAEDPPTEIGGEKTLRAQSWRGTTWKVSGSTLHVCHLDGCEFDLRDGEGNLLLKSWKVVTTSARLHGVLHVRRCSHGKGAHPPIEGRATGPTGVYPRKLAKNIARIIVWRNELPKDIRKMHELYINASAGTVHTEEMLHSDDCCAEEVPTERQVQDVGNYLKRVHANLGHPSNHCLVKMSGDVSTSPQAVKMAADFRCDDCGHRRLPASRMPVSTVVVEPRAVNARDAFVWTHPVPNDRCMGIIFADEGNRGYTAQVLKSGGFGQHLGGVIWADVRAAFLAKWMHIFGKPRRIRPDPTGASRRVRQEHRGLRP